MEANSALTAQIEDLQDEIRWGRHAKKVPTDLSRTHPSFCMTPTFPPKKTRCHTKRRMRVRTVYHLKYFLQ